MKTSLSRHLLLLAAPIAFVLAGCGDRSGTTPATPAPTAGAETPAKPAAPAKPRSYPADYGIDTALKRGDVAVRMTLVGEPVYVLAKDQIEFSVRVSNNGRVPLVTNGKMPVRLGVTLAGPEGVDVAPGNRDFRRVRLPLIVPGTSQRVTVRVPAKDVDGLTIRLEPIQEGAAWFGKRFKQPTLDVGPFHACADAAGGVCDADELPLETR